MGSDFIEWSYERHDKQEQEGGLPSPYTHPDSIDAWLYDRKLNMVLPLIHSFPAATWMTVGDGRYGSDANFLKKNGADATATSLADASLHAAFEQHLIDKYHAENAEKISFADNTFDFVLCKESYHHFPRPPIALYEMLRVAKKGIVLIEPVENGTKLFDFLKRKIKLAIRGQDWDIFESSGNFIFRVNITEMEKVATALGYHALASKMFNNFHHPKFSPRPYRKFSTATLFIKAGLLLQDILSITRLTNYGLATVIIFKDPISADLKQRLLSAGFHIRGLPKNPYLQNAE